MKITTGANDIHNLNIIIAYIISHVMIIPQTVHIKYHSVRGKEQIFVNLDQI